MFKFKTCLMLDSINSISISTWQKHIWNSILVQFFLQTWKLFYFHYGTLKKVCQCHCTHVQAHIVTKRHDAPVGCHWSPVCHLSLQLALKLVGPFVYFIDSWTPILLACPLKVPWLITYNMLIEKINKWCVFGVLDSKLWLP